MILSQQFWRQFSYTYMHLVKFLCIARKIVTPLTSLTLTAPASCKFTPTV